MDLNEIARALSLQSQPAAAKAIAAAAERIAELTEALSRLLKAAKTVQGYGARPGTQWTDLSFGIVCALAALNAAPPAARTIDDGGK